MSLPGKKDILTFMQSQDYRPMRIRELAHAMRVPHEHYRSFRRTVEDMVRTGELVETRRRYALPGEGEFVVGHLHAHQGGFGFVTPASDGDEPDIFVDRRGMGQALHGDRVMVRLFGRRRGLNPEGEIVRVVERGQEPIVGMYRRDDPDSYIIPDDPRISRNILIPRHETKGAKTGQKVVAHITEWARGSVLPQGRITEVLGYPNEPGLEILELIRSYDLPLDFPDPVLNEAERLSETIPEAVYKKRLDLRHTRCFTIDPPGARDFDDAVSIELLPAGGYRLGVHIADVSHYIPEGGLIDREALYRGTSVYLVDRVIPMLPHRLTNHICSLNPEADRLTMSVIMDIDIHGVVRRFEIEDTLICSVRRLTYEEAQELIEEGDADDPLVTDLRHLRDLSRVLRVWRMARGSLDFDLPEPLVLLDEEGRPLDVRKEERLDSHRLIEECMLAANRTVAGYLLDRNVPALYRIHDKPDAEKLTALQALLAGFGYTLTPEDVSHPRQLQRFLEAIKDAPDHLVINDLIIRSMKKARYAVENIGHYGLAFDRYTHFTSPIRRYPDLVVHRLVREVRRADLPETRLQHLDRTLHKTADIASRRETLAEEAERESVKIKQAEYMEQRIGDEYSGVISGVVPVGFFVELEDSLIDGLVHVASLTDDYYQYDPERRHLMGERTRRLFRLGDRVRVRVMRADRRSRRIDFELVEHQTSSNRFKPSPPLSSASQRGRWHPGKRKAADSRQVPRRGGKPRHRRRGRR